MDFLSLIINPIIESVMVPIKKHLGFLVSSSKYVSEMKAKMNQLNHTQHDIQEKRNTSDAKNHEVSHHVSPWLEDVKKMKEKAESIKTSGIGCFNVAKRYKAGKQSYFILKEIKALKEQESEITWTNEQKSLARVPSISTPAPSGTENNQIPSDTQYNHISTQNNFESRNLIFKDVLKAIQPNTKSKKMFALCGMGGVGKTTMMEQLKKVAEDSKMFDWVVKVVLGENTDPIALQRAISEYISKDLTETTKDARADRLLKIFEGMSDNGKRNILVIMDDVWKAFDLKDVGLCPLPNGFKILFTSRFEYICTQMGVKTDSIFNVHVLDEEEAKTLFFGIVGLSDTDDPDLQKIGEDIVKICGGLPIAITTIAKVLSSNIKEAWKETLSNLQNHDLQDLHKITHKVFEMSYNNLGTKDDKAIYLLSGIFPEDFNIPIEDLLMYAWGLKMFTKVHTLAKARRRINICVNNLIRANLLTKSESMGCVKIHDLARAFVLSNFSNVKQASIVKYDDMSQRHIEDPDDSYERILLKCTSMSEFHAEFPNYDNLSLLILMDGNKTFRLPKDLHRRMEKLRVVSYVNMYIPSLPKTFVHSTELETLCLHSCSLIDDDISIVGSLSNLETLSFSGCGLRRLPSTIGKLKKLKLLDLTGCVNLCIENGVFQNLESLEELYMRASPSKLIRFTDANCDEFEILLQRLFALELEFFENKARSEYVSFKNIERFRISIGCELKKTEKYSFTNTLNLVADCNKLQECNIMDLFEKTEELQLQVNDMNSLEDLSFQHSFSQLRVLHVSKCEDLTYLFTFSVSSGLKKLERLKISKCPIMRKVVGESSGDGVIRFPKLKFMSLIDLPNLVSLCDNVIEFPEMVELRLDGLPNFTSIYSDNMCVMQSLFNKEVALPKLEKLSFSGMKNLKQIWSRQISPTEKNNVSTLKKISICQCDSLMDLFPINPLPLLYHLEELEVEYCDSVKVLFNIDFERVGEMEGYISRLRSIKVRRLMKLKELWRVRNATNADIFINAFRRVESIGITFCERFKNLFTPTTTNFDLGALTRYIARESGEKIDGVLKGEGTKMDDYIPNLRYPSYLLRTFHHLRYLRLDNDKRVGEVVFEMDSPIISSRQLSTIQPSLLPLPYLQRLLLCGDKRAGEVVFEMDSPSSRHVPTFQHSLLLPNLEVLYLGHLEKLSHVWKCNNWNAFLTPPHQPQRLPFQNLTFIHLERCHKIKYLFSPLMAKYLSNLKGVDICICDGIEEVISSRDDENEEYTTSTYSHPNITFFPCLNTLTLKRLSELKCVDVVDERSRSDKSSSNITNNIHQFESAQVIGVSWSFCQYPRKIDIYACDALGSLIPWYAVEQMKKLEELEIMSCSKMMEVFESEPIHYSSDNVDEGSANDSSDICTTLTSTLTGSTIENITTLVVPQLSNLKSVSISHCNLLQHIFTFSTLESLKRLKRLEVKNCIAIQVIVKEENGTSSDTVVLPNLETLELDGLPNLKGFFLGVNDFTWPSLDDVMINDCPQLMIFTFGQSKSPKLKYIRTILGKHSLKSCGLNFQTAFLTSSHASISKGMPMPCSFRNLIEVNYTKIHFGERPIIPCHALLQLQNLEKITIQACYRVQEVFEVELEGRNNSGFNETQTTVVEIPNLTQLNLDELNHLKYLWKSTQWMLLEFPNLTIVTIENCNSIRHVFTCSMAGSLLQLQDLHISDCKNIQVIIKKEKEACDVKVNEIMLPRLKALKLYNLSSLKGFCLGNETFSLPALDTLEIKGCPAITMLTKGHLYTPQLEVIDTSFGLYYAGGDINSFIETKQEEWIEQEDDLSQDSEE